MAHSKQSQRITVALVVMSGECMRFFIAAIFLVSSMFVFASSPITTIDLTGENAKDYGFEIKSTEYGEYYNVEWAGPESYQGCYAGQSIWLSFKDNRPETLGAGSVIRFSTNEAPSGVYTQLKNEDVAMLTISYYCKEDSEKSRMFVLRSIRGELIESTGSRFLSRKNHICKGLRFRN